MDTASCTKARSRFLRRLTTRRHSRRQRSSFRPPSVNSAFAKRWTQPLARFQARERVEMLKAVTFQKDLGSYYEKASRMARLVNIGGADFDHPKHKINRNALHEAAWLAKTDLTTELVKEFTELQGVIGGLYARAQGLNPAVADAIYDHYKPVSMEDAAPRTPEAAMVALADK